MLDAARTLVDEETGGDDAGMLLEDEIAEDDIMLLDAD